MSKITSRKIYTITNARVGKLVDNVAFSSLDLADKFIKYVSYHSADINQIELDPEHIIKIIDKVESYLEQELFPYYVYFDTDPANTKIVSDNYRSCFEEDSLCVTDLNGDWIKKIKHNYYFRINFLAPRNHQEEVAHKIIDTVKKANLLLTKAEDALAQLMETYPEIKNKIIIKF